MTILASNRSYQYLCIYLESGKYEFKMSPFATATLNMLFAEAEQKSKTRNFRAHWTWIGRFERRQVVSRLEVKMFYHPLMRYV